ncbi:Nucleotide-diphospho-sugar transferase [Sesbania bispinosa]|nr:Nucleotide-diphospho-sugar transferase [Sesbania bispinosa]
MGAPPPSASSFLFSPTASSSPEHKLRTTKTEPNVDGSEFRLCNNGSSLVDKLVGWNTFNSLRYSGRSVVYIDDRAPVLPSKLEWSRFVLNSRLLWKNFDDKPEWIKDLDALEGVGEEIESPLFLLKTSSVVEPLGNCGRQILLWWLGVEARTDSKFPAQ